MTLLSPVCRQLYAETSLLPFQLNSWCFASISVMERYVGREKRLSRDQRRAVRTLYVNTHPTKTVQKYFRNLETLVSYSAHGGMRKRVLGGSRADMRLPVRNKRAGQEMKLYDT